MRNQRLAGFCIGLGSLLLASAAFAGEDGTYFDQVRQSFDRILTDRGSAPARPAVQSIDEDPLRSRIQAVLWQSQPAHCAFARNQYAAAEPTKRY